MSNLRIRVPTGFRSLSEARPALERALREGEPLVRARWEGETLHLTGPGARAHVTCAEGELVGRAELKPPASFFASTIERQFDGILRQVAQENPAKEQSI